MHRKTHLLNISEMAAKYDISPRALRFYEDCGLLSSARLGVMRYYSPQEEIRLQMIQKGKMFGFSLSEIGEIISSMKISGANRDQTPDPRPRSIAELMSADQVKAQLSNLERKRHRLDGALKELYQAAGRA